MDVCPLRHYRPETVYLAMPCPQSPVFAKDAVLFRQGASGQVVCSSHPWPLRRPGFFRRPSNFLQRACRQPHSLFGSVVACQSLQTLPCHVWVTAIPSSVTEPRKNKRARFGFLCGETTCRMHLPMTARILFIQTSQGCCRFSWLDDFRLLCCFRLQDGLFPIPHYLHQQPCQGWEVFRKHFLSF